MANFKVGDTVKRVRGGNNGSITLEGEYVVCKIDGTGSVFVKGHSAGNDPNNLDLVSSVAQQGQMEGNIMVYQVVIEKVTLATATTPEKRDIVVAPQTVEAYDNNEALCLAMTNENNEIVRLLFQQKRVRETYSF